ISVMPHSDWYSDTDPRALEVFLECQRRMTASEKVNGMLGLTRMVFETAEAEVRRSIPALTSTRSFCVRPPATWTARRCCGSTDGTPRARTHERFRASLACFGRGAGHQRDSLSDRRLDGQRYSRHLPDLVGCRPGGGYPSRTDRTLYPRTGRRVLRGRRHDARRTRIRALLQPDPLRQQL